MNLWLAEFGQLLLISTFVWSVFGIFVKSWSRVQFILLSSTIVFLGISFVSNDFSINYIYQNSHTLLPWYYRICAVWGAHEGSWLLWSWLLSLFTFLTVRKLKLTCPLEYCFAVEKNVAVVMAAFTGFMLFTSNPFIRSVPLVIAEGKDLNPLLQDPGMIVHPPLLYSGYVGFVLVFAMALASLNKKEFSEIWQKPAAKIAKLAWVFLTAGIVLGSWWAYRELGWGGFWGWDPVENASLLPWLTGTALIHLLINKYQEQRLMVFIFSATCFFLSILGTFLLRSGLVISVHAFAQDPSRGLALLIIMSIIISACTYYLYKRREILNYKINLHGQDKLIRSQAWLFAIAAATVLLGTMYPLISQVLWGENLSVGAPYFNQMLLPSLLLIMFLMAQVIKTTWHSKQLLLFTIFVAVISSAIIFKSLSMSAVLFTGLLFLLLNYLICFIGRKAGFVIAHLGFLAMLIGVVIAANFTVNNISYINIGDTVKIADYNLKLLTVNKLEAKHYNSYIAKFNVNGEPLTSEERFYQQRGMSLPKVGIFTTWLGSDIYVAFSHNDDSWIVRSYYRPMVRWIWIGGLLMVLGALFTFRERRL